MKINLSDFKRMQETEKRPDLSYYGEYKDNVNGVDTYIDRMGDVLRMKGKSYTLPFSVHYERNELRYFIPTNADKKKYIIQDFQRMESYGEQWDVVGVWVEVQVTFNGIAQTLRSSSLWGVESDSDEETFDELYADQEESLISILGELGIEVVND